jgi:hypothetical protein
MEYPNATYTMDEDTIPVRPSNHDGSHEGIPPGQEKEHLSELKQVSTEYAREQYSNRGTPQKGSVAAVAQSAMGKYASALGVIFVFAKIINSLIPN